MHQFQQPPISSAFRRLLARQLVGLPLKDVVRDLVLETLASTDGNRTASARLLGLSVRTLRNKITEYSADGVEVTPTSGGAQALHGAGSSDRSHRIERVAMAASAGARSR